MENGLEILKSIRSITKMIRRLQEELDMTYSSATNITQKIKAISVQTSASGDSMADRIAEIIEYQNQIEAYQNELYKKKGVVLHTLMMLPVEEQQMLLLRYFKGMTIEGIAEELDWSYRWTWDKLHEAERKFNEKYSVTS